MRHFLTACAALLAGCGGGPEPRPDDGDFTRPKPALRDYRRLAEEVVDGIAALGERFVCLEGLAAAWPAGEGAELTLRHERAGTALDVVITTGRGGEGLPYEIGRLRIFLKATGPSADSLLPAIRERLDRQYSWFVSRFDPEDAP